MLRELDEYYSSLHNSSEPDKEGGMADPRTCGLCGTTWEKPFMACDKDACECYCPDCIKEGDVERYLTKNDYTTEMIKAVINTVEYKHALK